MKEKPANGTTNTLKLEPFKPTCNLTFHNEGETVRELSWETGVLVFAGNAEESAKILFNNLLKDLVDEYIKEKLDSERTPTR